MMLWKRGKIDDNRACMYRSQKKHHQMLVHQANYVTGGRSARIPQAFFLV
jgi:hypothetical protein